MLGVLTVSDEAVPISSNPLHLKPESTNILFEGGILMEGLENLPEVLCLLFGAVNALSLGYPQAMKNSFIFIQRLMLGLGQML